MTRHVAVLLGDRQIAHLERTRSQVVRLTYESDPGTTPLSLSLPITTRVHTGPVVEQFLWGLLPDNDGALTEVERQHGADPRDPLSLLSAIGKDCAGAAQFCPDDEVAATLARTGTLEPYTDTDIEMRLAELGMDETASWTMAGEHWSLGGTQAKFALRQQDGRWYIAQGAEPTTHIVKPGVHKLKSQALIEHASMRAAEHLGLLVAHTEYTEFKSENAIVITRFDRPSDQHGTVTRLHQEDLCQALGTAKKYEEHGGPSAANIIEVLRQQSPTPSRALANVAQFTDGLIFNTVIGAPDAHARNYAVMLDGEDVHLAPLFDVATGLAYTARDARKSSMSIGGDFDLDTIDADSWCRFAESASLDPEAVLGRARELADLAPAAVERALGEIEDDHDGTVTEVRARLVTPLRHHTKSVVRRRS